MRMRFAVDEMAASGQGSTEKGMTFAMDSQERTAAEDQLRILELMEYPSSLGARRSSKSSVPR